MIKFIVAKHDDKIFNSYIFPSMKKINSQLIQLTDDPGKPQDSIFIKYNIGIQGLTNVGYKEDDILVFVHEDVKILDQYFAEKLEMIFKDRSDIGLIGVAGTDEYTENGGWWQSPQDKLHGHIFQEKNNGKIDHMVWNNIGYFDNVVTVDGCLFAIRGKLFKDGLRFDHQTYNNFDFYDVDICLSVLEMGYKVSVADILIQHKSMGMGSTKDSWKIDRDKCINKWKNKGKTFPITVNQFNIKEMGIINVEL